MLKKQSRILKQGATISKKISPNTKSLPDHHFKKVKVKRGLSGLGLFAGEDIRKGELIIEYIGDILTKEEADKVTNCQYLFEVSRNRTINGSPRWNIARYANHSCDGNAESDIKKGRVFVKATKNIKEGEEIVYDYGEEFVKEYIVPYGCQCSSEKHLYGLMPARSNKKEKQGKE
jgi:SET domain-containing protein